MSGPPDTSLPARYVQMAQDFVDNGLNVNSIATMLEWFDDGSQHGLGMSRPKLYTEFDNPLPENCVRLLVLPVAASKELERAGEQITAEISQLLKPHAQLFNNIPGYYHITIHHTSNPWDPRPVPMHTDGGTDISLPAAERAGPTASELEAEVFEMRKLVAGTPAPTVVLERVLLANSGTLLLCWVDQGVVEEMRGHVWEKFPGSCKKQPNIIHTSLARVATAAQIPPDVRQQVHQLCEQWTQKLRGTPLHCSDAWFIFEREFSTIQGLNHVLPFQQQ